MSITIHFTNQNEDEDEIRIYRADTPFTINELPPLYDTTGAGATSYTDANVTVEQTYYYMLATVRGSNVVYSTLLETKAEATATGPGPQRPIATESDYSAGFFGEIQYTQLIDGDTLADQIELTAGMSAYPKSPWLKFYSDDKILFIPKQPLRYNLSWDDINAVKAVYGGVDDAAVHIRGLNYRVRLMTGGNNDPSSGPGGEWNRLMYPVTTVDVMGRSWATYTTGDLMITSGWLGGPYTWCQETDMSNANNRVRRGASNNITYYLYANSNLINAGYGWRPVLELIP